MRSVLINKLVKRFLLKRYSRIEKIREYPHQIHEKQFKYLTHKAKNTEFGKRHHFHKIRSYADFVKTLPVVNYEDVKSDIFRMMNGEPNILWPGVTKWYAKSSGTTNDKSKFIPVTDDKFKKCHVSANWHLLSIIYHQRPDSEIFAKKNLVTGGSLERFHGNPQSIIGDVSAIMIKRIPFIARPFYTPDSVTALLHDWEEKLERMSDICPKENIVMIGGVPTWTIVLFRKILQKTGKSHILEVWPELKTYIHGGVGFGPYRDQFKEFLPGKDIDYVEVYNASEGYFAVQDEMKSDELLLLLDQEIFYEFVPSEEWNSENPLTIPLQDVEVGKNYGLVISSSAGLWRYMPGDTIQFTNIRPYRMQVTGRTNQYINAFGEELMVSNTDQAIAYACDKLSAIVTEYTVAPIYFDSLDKAGHEWVIEFEKSPKSIPEFARILDKRLQQINSDYEAKRFKNLALGPLKIVPVPEGSFVNWMKEKGKAGGQNKVPRLSNDRDYIRDLLQFVKSSGSYVNR